MIVPIFLKLIKFWFLAASFSLIDLDTKLKYKITKFLKQRIQNISNFILFSQKANKKLKWDLFTRGLVLFWQWLLIYRTSLKKNYFHHHFQDVTIDCKIWYISNALRRLSFEYHKTKLCQHQLYLQNMFVKYFYNFNYYF